MLRFINLKETFNLFPSFKKKKKLDSLRYKISRIVSLNLALIKKKKKHETTRPFLGRGLKRGHLLCQVSHQKVKQPASRELGELKIATCQVKHWTTTTRHVHVPKRGNWIRWNRVPPWWIRGVIRGFMAVGPCTMPMHVERGVLFQDTNRKYTVHACKEG